jgi:hypothetical protein
MPGGGCLESGVPVLMSRAKPWLSSPTGRDRIVSPRIRSARFPPSEKRHFRQGRNGWNVTECRIGAVMIHNFYYFLQHHVFLTAFFFSRPGLVFRAAVGP